MVFWKQISFVVVFSIFVLPGIGVIPGLPEVRLEYFLQIAVLFFLLFTVFYVRSGGESYVVVSFLFFAFFVFSSFSIIATSAIFGNRIIVNDFMILLSLVSYFTTMYVVLQATRVNAVFFVRSMIVLSIFVSTFGLFQKFNILSINLWATPFYTDLEGSQGAHSLQAVIDGSVWARIGGTHGDPRHYGYLLVAALAIPMASVLLMRNGLYRALALIAVVLSGFALLYTQSRTAILSAMVCTVIATGVYLVRHRRIKLLATMLLLISALVFAAGSFGSFSGNYLANRLFSTQGEYFIQSFGPRVTDLVTPFQEAAIQPFMWLLGMGPSKSILLGSAHSEIGFVFRRYGLPGLFFVFSLLSMMIYLSLRSFFREAARIEKIISLAALMVAINWAVTMFAESIIHDPQRMGANMVFLGALLALAHRSQLSPAVPVATPVVGGNAA